MFSQKLIALPLSLLLGLIHLLSLGELVHALPVFVHLVSGNYGRLYFSDVLHLVHHAAQSLKALLVVHLPRPSHLYLSVVCLFGKEDLQVPVEVGVGLFDPLQVEGLPLLAQLSIVLPVLLVEAALSPFSYLHELHQVLEGVLVLLLLDDGQLYFL